MEKTYAVEVVVTYAADSQEEAVDLLTSDITIALNEVSDQTDVFGINPNLYKTKDNGYEVNVIYVLATDLSERKLKEVLDTVVEEVVVIEPIED